MEYPIVFHLEVLRIISKVSYIYIYPLKYRIGFREFDRLGGISPQEIYQSTRLHQPINQGLPH